MEKPDWERFDSVKSVRDVFSLGRVALARLLESIDSRLADAINSDYDK